MKTLRRSLLLASLATATRAEAESGTLAAPPPNSDQGRTGSPTPLRSAIVTADSALFAAFNARDIKRLGTYLTPDLEFYQDNEGVAGYAQTIKDFRQMFGQATPIRRELVPGSLEVYPIKGYGAMEVGRHRFCHVEQGKDDCGVFSFVHIWRRTTKGWKISRVVSYGHQT